MLFRSDVHEYEEGLYAWMDERASDVLKTIRETGKLEESTEEQLKSAVQAYTDDFVKRK